MVPTTVPTRHRPADPSRSPTRRVGRVTSCGMENQSTLTDRDDEVVTDDDTELGAEVADELLIEEISIDGMCGVY